MTYVFKGNAQFIFLCKPQKSLDNVCLMKILKSTVKKKVLVQGIIQKKYGRIGFLQSKIQTFKGM